jgi:predicted RND superfamily exporter protein
MVKNLQVSQVLALFNAVKDLPETKILTSYDYKKKVIIVLKDKDLNTLPKITLKYDTEKQPQDEFMPHLELSIDIAGAGDNVEAVLINSIEFNLNYGVERLTSIIRDLYTLAKDQHLEFLRDYAEKMGFTRG